MIVLGISALHHDAAATVVDSETKEILFAAHSERSSGTKNDPHLSSRLVEAVKRFDPERIVWYERPWRKSVRRCLNFDFSALRDDSPRKYLARIGLDLPVDYVDHHHAHAAAGAYTSPFETAAVLVIDAIGEFDTSTVWVYRDRKLTRVFSRTYPQSFGLFYSAFTKEAGFKPNEEEYILMGLSAYGTDAAREAILDDAMDLTADFPIVKRNYHYGVAPEKYWKYPREDLARGAQLVYEAAFERSLEFVQRATGMKNLVFMGGCALNCLANRLIRRHFKAWWTMPNPGDAGSSLGAALAWLQVPVRWNGPFLGTRIGDEYPVEDALTKLLNHTCVGVASGRAEFGPRALGNRSLLADPRGEHTKDNVNIIKKREPFRPFAPVVLEQHFDQMFETDGDRMSPYMQCVYPIKRPDLYPAVTHVDGTSRVQTVNRSQHAGLFELLTRFFEKTGCPMLLNTSLNVKGFPLVDDAVDARRFREVYDVPVVGP